MPQKDSHEWLLVAALFFLDDLDCVSANIGSPFEPLDVG
jgi:hypothetical protein